MTRTTAKQPETTRIPRRSPRGVRPMSAVTAQTMITAKPKIKTQTKRMKTATANERRDELASFGDG